MERTLTNLHDDAGTVREERRPALGGVYQNSGPLGLLYNNSARLGVSSVFSTPAICCSPTLGTAASRNSWNLPIQSALPPPSTPATYGPAAPLDQPLPRSRRDTGRPVVLLWKMQQPLRSRIGRPYKASFERKPMEQRSHARPN